MILVCTKYAATHTRARTHARTHCPPVCCSLTLFQFEEAAKFFVTHSRKPDMELVIRGYHFEWESNFDGQSFAKEVDDWTCRMNITELCCDRWSFISAVGGLSFDSVVSAFCDANMPVRSVAMESSIEWNWQDLRAALSRLVKSTGWNGLFSITFPRISSSTVGIISSNRSTRLVTSSLMRGAAVIFKHCRQVLYFPSHLFL